MRKKIINRTDETPETSAEENWLNIEAIAEVEITSENASYPIESALIPGRPSGWVAGEEGKQTIRLVFDQPQTIRRVMLSFSEPLIERTHEYALNWYEANGELHEIARQQWNFSPNGATVEVENYHLDLPGVSVLELCINPDISNSHSLASLEQLRIA
jgi:hypothetical protein